MLTWNKWEIYLLLAITALVVVPTATAAIPYVEETPGMPKDVPDSWMTYHLFHPGPGTGTPADPNPAYFYKGRYHLHYI